MTDMTQDIAEASLEEIPTGVPLVQLKDVGKSYGNITALKGINLKVGKGEVTCVLGDNGAGKSTLIKIISGRHQHDEGELLVDGHSVKLGSPRGALDTGTGTSYQDLAWWRLWRCGGNFSPGSRRPTAPGRSGA